MMTVDLKVTVGNGEVLIKEGVRKVLKARLRHTLWQTFRVCQS